MQTTVQGWTTMEHQYTQDREPCCLMPRQTTLANHNVKVEFFSLKTSFFSVRFVVLSLSYEARETTYSVESARVP